MRRNSSLRVASGQGLQEGDELDVPMAAAAAPMWRIRK